MQTLWQDLRYGARMLLKQKSVTTIAVLSLALGIGANSALFSVADAVLLKTLPVKEPEQLVLFEWQAGVSFRYNGASGTSMVPEEPGKQALSLFRHDVFTRMRQAQAATPESPLSDFFAFAPLRELNAVIGQQAEVINGQAVSGGYYSGLGVQPELGRAITDEDDMAGAAPVVVLSNQFWQERFSANPAVIGQSLKLNQQSFTIIGVTPPAFNDTLQVDYCPAVTIPIASEPLLQGEKSWRLGTASEPGVWWLEKTTPLHITLRQMARENYFATLEIPFLRGRNFTAQDDARAPHVAIVNQTFAREFFPNDDALGKRITFSHNKRAVEIIGVVSDTKYQSQRRNFMPLLYTP
jgi:MacB-like periplasmic core domain